MRFQLRLGWSYWVICTEAGFIRLIILCSEPHVTSYQDRGSPGRAVLLLLVTSRWSAGLLFYPRPGLPGCFYSRKWPVKALESKIWMSSHCEDLFWQRNTPDVTCNVNLYVLSNIILTFSNSERDATLSYPGAFYLKLYNCLSHSHTSPVLY